MNLLKGICAGILFSLFFIFFVPILVSILTGVKLERVGAAMDSGHLGYISAAIVVVLIGIIGGFKVGLAVKRRGDSRA